MGNWKAAIRSLNVIEVCPFDGNILLHLSCYISDLGANMLAFSIAVCPYIKDIGVPGSSFNISGKDFLVLN